MSKHIKRVTFDPRKGNRFRYQIDGIPQPGKEGLVTRAEALTLVSKLVGSGATVVVGPKERSSHRRVPQRSQKKYGKNHR